MIPRYYMRGQPHTGVTRRGRVDEYINNYTTINYPRVNQYDILFTMLRCIVGQSFIMLGHV